MRPSRAERVSRALLRRAISRRTRLRGPVRADGRPTLLVVSYHSGGDLARLVGSFRRFVGDGEVVVVNNAGRLPDLGRDVRVLRAPVNLHHGLGLDFGMRRVQTEFALICDPDTLICGDSLWPQMRERVERFGAASIANGAAIYHPICMAFRTELWKKSAISMEQDWTRGWDVAGAITEALGGLRDEALLPRTRVAGPALPSARQGMVHHLGEVYGEAFSNTYSASRLLLEPDRQDFEGWDRSTILHYHRRWRAWGDAVVADTDGVEGFPTA